MRINPLAYILICWLQVPVCAYAQDTLTAIVLDRGSNTPLPYASVGIEYTATGTLTDTDGAFSLSIPERLRNADQRLTVSHLNYRTETFAFRDRALPDTIYLERESTELPTVTVAANTLGKTIVLGKDKNKTAATFRFSSNRLGTELGAMIKTKGDSILVKSLNFNIFRNDFSAVKFRVHLYETTTGEGTMSTRDLLTENVVVEYAESAGILSVDLSRQTIVLQPDTEYLISIEWLEDKGKAGNQLIQFAAGIGLKRNIFYKHAALSNWREHKKRYFGLNANLAFYIEGFALS